VAFYCDSADWRGVVSAVPQFIGHDQPRIPADLGFYDPPTTASPDALIRAVELAKASGLQVFVSRAGLKPFSSFSA